MLLSPAVHTSLAVMTTHHHIRKSTARAPTLQVPGTEFSIEAAMRLYGLTQFELLWERGKDTKCLVAWDDTPRIMVVAFRGTASMVNVYADLQARREFMSTHHLPVCWTTQWQVYAAGTAARWESRMLSSIRNVHQRGGFGVPSIQQAHHAAYLSRGVLKPHHRCLAGLVRIAPAGPRALVERHAALCAPRVPEELGMHPATCKRLSATPSGVLMSSRGPHVHPATVSSGVPATTWRSIHHVFPAVRRCTTVSTAHWAVGLRALCSRPARAVAS